MPQFLLFACLILEAALLASLVLRRRWRSSYLLTPCITSWLAADALVFLRPGFNTWTFWSFKESLHALLALGLGLELGWRLLAAAPLGQAAAKRWIAGVTLVAWALLSMPPNGPTEALARLVAALAWLYTGLTLVLARYSMPLTKLHGTLLFALPPYCLLYWLTWSRVGDDATLAGVVNPAAFVLVLGALSWASWTSDGEPPVEPALAHLVWPWTR